MNPDRLLALYERIADAPDAVTRLRRFILDLAVRGKLVPQDPADEPADDLLKRIAEEKAQLSVLGVIKTERQRNESTSSFDRFKLPEGWAWTELRTICTSVTDGDHQPPPKAESGVPFLVISDIRTGIINYSPARFVPRDYFDALDSIRKPRSGDLLYTLVGSFGIPVVVSSSEEFCVQRHIGILRPSQFVVVAFLARAMESEFVFQQADACATDIAQKTVPLAGLRRLSIPLPPLAEQHRIVAKVDELMALCDRLEAARARRESTRERLAAASLARLNTPDPDPATFTDHARFVLDALPALTTRADQIKQLRQTILNLAVRGKLVPQDPADEPAAELLERIASAKSFLAGIRGIRRVKALPPITDVETRFDLPDGWAWARLGNLSQFVTSGSRDWAQYYSNEGAIFVRMGNLSKENYRLRLDHVQRVTPPADGEGTRTRLEAGDILISITGDVGMLGLVPEGFGEAYINQHTAMVRPMPEMRGLYLPELFRSPFAQDQFKAPQRGLKNSFRLTDVNQFVVPLPPLAEQHRIVAKVDELMALCDRLEASLATADNSRRRLLDALLREALAPAMTGDST
ncbi:MAG: restriction endonuclease subunit S [Marichromatium sp.]|nr:restriction endonuclease subunit S [Marichromatium sp.]